MLRIRGNAEKTEMSIAKPDRLLIADDDLKLLAAFVRFFEEYGYEIRAVEDKMEAFAKYCAWHPEAVVFIRVGALTHRLSTI